MKYSPKLGLNCPLNWFPYGGILKLFGVPKPCGMNPPKPLPPLYPFPLYPFPLYPFPLQIWKKNTFKK